MKKIMFVIASLHRGGAEGVLSVVANQFAKKGFDVSVLTILSDDQDYTLKENIKIIKMIDLLKRTNKAITKLNQLKQMRKIFKEENPDMVVSFMDEVTVYVMLSKMGLKTPVIAAVRNDPQHSPQKPAYRWLRNFLFQFVDGIVFQTIDAQKYIQNKIGVKIRSTVIANPLKENLPVYHKQTNDHLAMTACRLENQKNLPMMIDAIALLHQRGVLCKLNIFGRGAKKDELQLYIEEKGMQNFIKLCDFCPTIHDEMLKSDLFLLSSNYEGISNSMLEALAIGLPVVVTDCPVGAARMYIKNQTNGCFVPVEDAVAFADAMESVFVDKKFAISMGQEAMKIRDQLTEDVIIDQWISFVCQIGERK